MQNKNNQLNLFIRSLVLSIMMIATCIPYALICLLSAPFLPLRLRYRQARLWIVWMLKLCEQICHIRYEIKGLHHVTKINNGILMSKHQSAWETFYIAANFDQVSMVAKKELLLFPFFGWALAILGPIIINRKDTKSAMQQLIQQGRKYLQAGRWVAIFPEGTRIPTGQAGKYRLGGARLAVETGYPIIPMAHNAGRFWPRRRFIKNPGTVQVIFGPPIDPKGKTPEEVLELTKNWIEDTMAKIDR